MPNLHLATRPVWRSPSDWMRGILLVAAYLWTAPVLPAGAQETRHLALTDATVIDGTGAAPIPGMTLLIEGDRIAGLFPTGSRELPAGVEVLHLAGRTVIPGLIDAHVHVRQLSGRRGGPLDRTQLLRELERMQRAGVLAAREMAGDMRTIAGLSLGALIGELRSPDLYYSALMAGPGFASSDPRVGRASVGHLPGSAPWIQAITPETDLRLAVARAAGTGATGVKIYAQLPGPVIAAISREAKRQGLAVWAHATVYPDRPIETARAGVEVMTHACGLGWQDADVDPAARTEFDSTSRPAFDATKVEADSSEMKALFAEMARRGTLFEPTLAMHLRPGDDPFGCARELMIELTRAAHSAGVRLVAGTDFVAPPEDPHPALHRELEALVDHGVLDPLEAITAATLHGAMALGLEAELGTLEPGKLANLVVLEEDPSHDIRALRSADLVVQRGRFLDSVDRAARSPLVFRGPSSGYHPR